MKSPIKPVISVIVPAYNEEKYIDACLTSLQKQVVGVPYEVIVVDNNSTDRTLQKTKAYPVRLLHERTPGASAARNTGARAARGNLIVFLDADSIAPKNHLARIVSYFERAPYTALVGGPYTIYDAGKLVRFVTGPGRYYTRWLHVQKLLTGYLGFLSGNFAMPRSIYRKIGGFDESLNDVLMAEDMEFAVRMKRAGYAVTLSDSIPVLSSFRRIKRAPVRTSILRMINVRRHTKN